MQLNSNQLKVEFRKPEAKNIVSKHSGSILATDEPKIELSIEILTKLQQHFEKSSDDVQNQIVSREKLAQIFISCGIINVSVSAAKDIIKRKIDLESFTESDAILAASVVCAPTYYYGNRLRRNVCRGEIDDITDLLARGCNPNCCDGEGLTPLHYAAEFGRVDSMLQLFEKCKDVLIVDAKDKYGWSPLFTAVHHGKHKCVRLLLKCGASVAATNSNVDNLLYESGKTALHIGCSQNRGSICDLLLAAGASLDCQDFNGMTPLHDAAFHGHGKLFSRLLSTATNTKAIDQLGFTAADYLAANPVQENEEIPEAVEFPPPTPREPSPIPDAIIAPVEEQPAAVVVPDAKVSTKKAKK